MALHSGEAESRAGDYFGSAVNRAARLMAAASGGQMLLSRLRRRWCKDNLPDQATLRDLGEHRLRDLSRPERVFQLVAPDLPADFPPLKTLASFRHNLPAQLTSFVGREGEIGDLRQALAAARLLTLTVLAGPAKPGWPATRTDVLPAFPDGVWLVELAPLADPALHPPAIASEFGLQSCQVARSERWSSTACGPRTCC